MGGKAVIDVGTNSVKLLVAGGSADGVTVLRDRTEIARLGEGMSQEGLAAAAMERTAGTIAEMTEEARSLGADEILAVGTQALRTASNASDFLRMVESRCGVRVRVISGEEEAALSFHAARSTFRMGESDCACVLDVGGGSSEVVYGDGRKIEYRRSVPVGALVLHKAFFGDADGRVSRDVLEAAGNRVRSLLCAEGVCGRGAQLRNGVCVGVGGTITTLGAVMLELDPYDPDRVCGALLTRDEVERQVALYASVSVGERLAIIGMPPKRADIILAGACIVRELLAICGGTVSISDRGLRYGLMERLLVSTAS